MRQTAIVLAALLAIPATSAAQQTQVVDGNVYRCNINGTRGYTREPIPGADCSPIGYSFLEEAGLDIPMPAGWVPYAQDDEGVVSYYRAGDVRRSGQRVTFWVLDNHPADQFVPNTGVGTFRSSIQRLEVDCGERSYRAVQGSYYAASLGKGRLVGSPYFRGNIHQYAVPGSTGELMVNAICALEP